MRIDEFYHTLYNNCHDGTVVLFTLPDRTSRQYDLQQEGSLDALISDAERYGHSTNTYICVNPRKTGITSNIRGAEENIASVVAIAADYDVFGPAHVEKDLPPTKEAVLSHLQTLALEPTVIVDSGYGVYAYWIFDVPFSITDEAELTKAKGTVSGFGNYLKKKGLENGWKLDNVFDLPRMLRAPGSLNFKLEEPVQSKIISSSGILYSLDDFDAYYETPPTIESIPFQADSRTVGSSDRIMEKCLFIQKLRDDTDAVTEPEWKAALSNIVLAVDGSEKGYEFSAPYSRYSYEETDSKIRYSLAAAKPCTCRYIHDTLGFNCPEGGCGVKAPIVHALFSKQEQIQNLLALDKISAEEALESYLLDLTGWAKEHAPADYGRIKLRVKKTGLGLRDFERAVSCEMDRRAEPEFDVLPKEIVLEGIQLHGAMEPAGYRVSMENGVTSCSSYNGAL